MLLRYELWSRRSDCLDELGLAKGASVDKCSVGPTSEPEQDQVLGDLMAWLAAGLAG